MQLPLQWTAIAQQLLLIFQAYQSTIPSDKAGTCVQCLIELIKTQGYALSLMITPQICSNWRIPPSPMLVSFKIKEPLYC